MQIEIKVDRILITPQNELEEAYLCDTLGLKQPGDRARCKLKEGNVIEITKRSGGQQPVRPTSKKLSRTEGKQKS